MTLDKHTRRFLPQVGHWSDDIATNQDGSLFAVFHLSGLAAEMAGARAVISAHLGDNQLARNITDPRIEWWDHDVRQDGQRMSDLPAIANWFASRFDAAYQANQGGAALFRNDLFLTVLMHPEDGLRSGLRALFGGGASKDTPTVPDPMVQDFQGVLQRLEAGLFRYGARRLGLREQGGVVFSEIAEAFHLVANGHFRPLALTVGRMGALIVPERIVFGHRDWQIMGEGEPLFGAILSFKDYPARTSPTMFAELRRVPFPITITNSARFRQKAAALSTIGLRVKHMQSGNDAAKTQIQELTQDEDDVMSGRSVYVSHGFSVAVRASSLIDLDRRVARVQSLLSDAGVTSIRETDAIKAAFFAQLPGNLRWRPRPGLTKSINAAGMAAKHGVRRGTSRSRWGAPIVMLRTTSDTEYAFHFHAQGAEQSPAEDVGSFMMFGGTGTGKTGLLGTLSMLALRVPAARVVIVDKGLGLSVLVRALGGSYLPITYGQPSGFAPLLAYENTPEDVSHIVRLLRSAILSDGKGDVTSDEDARLQRGVQRQMMMPPHMRSLAGVAAMLGQRDKEGAAARLGKWCRGQRLGWVMDNDADQVDLSARITGIDPSSLFGDEVACAPLLADFFYRVRKLINGDPIMLVVDEAWQLDKVEAFRDDIQGHLKEIRKKEGVVAMATQNVGTVVRSANAEDYRKQIPTKIFFADDSASRADLIDGMGLTEAEFLAVTETLPNMRHTFLLKRPGGSVLCRFDLSGIADKLAVISARTKTYELMNRLVARYGPAPEAWVPHFERLAPSVAADPTAEQEDAAA